MHDRDRLLQNYTPTRSLQQLQHQHRSLAVSDVGRMYHMHHQFHDQTQRIDDDVPLASAHLLARVVPADPLFSVVFTLWLSMIAALGLFFFPAFFRTLSRSASWIVFHVPSLRNRRK